jgi:MFS family permease
MADAPEAPPRAATVALVAMLAATTILSQFYRSSLGVIAPTLIAELSIAPAVLGLVGSAFFWALLAAQVPVGLLFDRVGARATVAGLSLLAAAGSVAHAFVASGAELGWARVLVGIGHGGSFMATVYLVSRWYPRARWATVLSWVFGLSMIGVVLAGTPLAYAAERIGWRAVFVAMGAVSLVVGALFWVLVRDDPPGRTVPTRAPERLLDAVAGFAAVLRLDGLGRVLGLQAVAYAVLATIMGLWAGPYLADVHGLGPIARGNVLIAMAAANTTGVLAYGPLDRRFGSRKRVAIAGALATLALLTVLALGPSLPIAVAALVAVSATSAYGIVVVTHARTFYPDHLAGRGTTTANAAQLIGCAALPALTGLIPAFYPLVGSGYHPDAYRWIFAAIALALASGLAVYATSRDVPP